MKCIYWALILAIFSPINGVGAVDSIKSDGSFNCSAEFAKIAPIRIVGSELGNLYKGGGSIPLVGEGGVRLSPWQNNSGLIEVSYPHSGDDIVSMSYVYDAVIKDPKGQQIHKMIVVVPGFTKPDGNLDDAFTQMITQQTVRVIGSLPLAHIDSVKKVKVHGWDYREDMNLREKFPGLSGAAGGSLGTEIAIFRIGLPSLMDGTYAATMRHEFGHNIATKFWGSATPGPEYINPAIRDANGVSEYGNTSWAEDFAEAMVAYIGSDGGRLDPSIRAKFANRFDYIDRIFALDPRNRQFAAYSYALALVSAGGVFAEGARVYQTEKDVVIDNGNGRFLLIQIDQGA